MLATVGPQLPAAAASAVSPLARVAARMWYSRRLRTTPSVPPLARSSEPATRDAICSPLAVTIGTPAHSASLPVVWQLYSGVSSTSSNLVRVRVRFGVGVSVRARARA